MIQLDHIIFSGCIELRPPKNGNLSCVEENDEVTCTPYCLFGQRFISDVRSNYTCGPSTNYMWTDQLSVHEELMTLPGCVGELCGIILFVYLLNIFDSIVYPIKNIT